MIYAMHAPTLRLSQHVPQVKQRSPVHTPRTPVQASLQRKSGLDAPARVVVAGFAALWMATVAHAAHASTCPNFTMAPNGLQYCDEVVGTGTTPAAGSLIKAHYTGRLASTGVKFDSSYDRGRPLTFKIGVGEVIRGWDQGILGTGDGAIPSMKEGGKRKLIIPSDLAYGERGAGRGLIPGGAVLEFDVELVARK